MTNATIEPQQSTATTAAPATAEPRQKTTGRSFGIPEVVDKLDPSVLATFDPHQSILLHRAIESALPRSSPKILDWRTTLPGIRSRWFFVFQMGLDRGRSPLQRAVSLTSRIFHIGVAVLLLLGLGYGLTIGVAQVIWHLFGISLPGMPTPS